MSRAGSVALALMHILGAMVCSAQERAQKKPFVPTSAYAMRELRGWTVRVNKRLLDEEKDLGNRALALLERKLDEIVEAIPPDALAELRQVPIWLGVDDGHAPCAEYHPSREWLERNGHNPDKARSVEIGNASRFVEWSKTQPSMVLHELAHAFHDRVYGYDDETITAAHRRAVRSGCYDSVRHAGGRTERHYALSSPQEYFAECTEAYYGRNDFEPFTRAELERFDPEGAALVRLLWERPRVKSGK